ncbi:MAG: phage tail sheath family protein [Alphaproteobacteria bacterium]|nr:phage tail sheath family protein [Alphaproteobacteria bacterium]
MASPSVIHWLRARFRPAAAGSGRPRRIDPAETGVCAFVGPFPAGPPGQSVRVDSGLAFERDFGGAAGDGEACLQVAQFFRNGGAVAVLLRTPDASHAALLDGLDRISAADAAFDLLCVPDGARGADPYAVFAAAAEAAAKRQAMLLVDAPPAAADARSSGAWVDGLGSALSRDAALYWPRLRLPSGAELGASGSVAGVMARTDRARGVWKAPAGPEATVHGAELAGLTAAEEADALNGRRVNVLREVAGSGPVVWGARTLGGDGEDGYVPVRRLMLFLERSLRASLAWVVFEPNDEPLWGSVKAGVDGFLADLWRKGALVGAAPRAAWFVRCDRTTMTQTDIDDGRLHLLIGVAPTKPAEFVILRLVLQASPS